MFSMPSEFAILHTYSIASSEKLFPIANILSAPSFSHSAVSSFLLKAEKMLLTEKNTLFDDLIKKMEDFPEIKSTLKDILYYGKEYSFNLDIKVLNLAAMFNFIKNVNGKVRVFNRTMETRLYNLFTNEEELLATVERAICLFRDKGIAGERFADTVNRLGFENVEKELMGE